MEKSAKSKGKEKQVAAARKKRRVVAGDGSQPLRIGDPSQPAASPARQLRQPRSSQPVQPAASTPGLARSTANRASMLRTLEAILDSEPTMEGIPGEVGRISASQRRALERARAQALIDELDIVSPDSQNPDEISPIDTNRPWHSSNSDVR